MEALALFLPCSIEILPHGSILRRGAAYLFPEYLPKVARRCKAALVSDRLYRSRGVRQERAGAGDAVCA